MIILNKENIQKCITMEKAIEICKEATKNYCLNKTDIPLRTPIISERNNGQVLLFQEKYLLNQITLE